MANILVTGGAGYIGSHACKALNSSGHRPVTYDNLCRGHSESVKWGPLVKGDLCDIEKLKETMKAYQIEGVIHFAAFAYVGESTAHPEMYFENNVAGSLSLLIAMHECQLKKLVFSSSCATYGETSEQLINESTPQNPINPYGLSKWMVEQILKDCKKSWGLNFCGLRYFNAGGADPDGELGECHAPEPHILPNLIGAALNGKPLKIYGGDYPTIDGSCVRDFIHVSDLAQAHVHVMNRLLQNHPIQPFYNLGEGRGFSLLQLIHTLEKLLKTKINYEITDRRPGDPSHLVADSSLFRSDFSWANQHSDIETILSTALDWLKRKSNDLK